MNIFYYDYYYYYYSGWEFIGLFGIGIFSVIGSFFALIGILKKTKVPLAIGGLLNIYNAGGVIVFLVFWFLPEIIGVGAVVCLTAGILLLVAAFMSEFTSYPTKNYESFQMSSVNNIVSGYDIVENNSASLVQSHEYPSSQSLIRYCRFCGKKLH